MIGGMTFVINCADGPYRNSRSGPAHAVNFRKKCEHFFLQIDVIKLARITRIG